MSNLVQISFSHVRLLFYDTYLLGLLDLVASFLSRVMKTEVKNNYKKDMRLFNKNQKYKEEFPYINVLDVELTYYIDYKDILILQIPEFHMCVDRVIP